MKAYIISSSRRNSFFSILTWIFINIAINVLYRYLENAPIWTPTHLNYIDIIYSIINIFTWIIIVIHVIYWIFSEIEHSFLSDGAALRRFLPLIRVISVSLVWVIGGFYLLDSLHINTTSILTGAGIGGVLLAIASRDIITNLFGSLSILLSRTFEIGEIIRLQLKSNAQYEGLVEEITLNYTKMTRVTGEVVFIPNRLIYTETIENISRRRFFDYIYRVPFKKQSSMEDVKTRMRIIEGKIASYNPIEVSYETEIPNAVDLVYKITVLLPEENENFDETMRHFLMEHIFIEPEKNTNTANNGESSNLQK